MSRLKELMQAKRLLHTILTTLTLGFFDMPLSSASSHSSINSAYHDLTKPEDISAITELAPNALAEVDGDTLIRMPLSGIAALSDAQRRALPLEIHQYLAKKQEAHAVNDPELVACVDTEFVRYIRPAVIGEMNPLQIQAMLPEVIAELTKEQLHALTSRPQQEALQNEVLSRRQISWLLPEQAACIFQKGDGLTLRHASALTPEQMSAFSWSLLLQLPAIFFNALNCSALQSLTQMQLKSITPDVFSEFNSATLTLLTPVQCGYLRTAHIEAIPDTMMQSLSAEQFRAFTPDQIVAFSGTQVASFSLEQLRDFGRDIVTRLSKDQLQHLTDAQRAQLDDDTQYMLSLRHIPIEDIPATEWQKLQPWQFGEIAHFARLKQDTIAALPPAFIAAVSPEQLARTNRGLLQVLSSEQVQALTNTQLAALSFLNRFPLKPAQVAQLTREHLELLRHFAGFHAQQLQALRDDHIKVLKITQLENAIQFLLPSQIALLSPEQFTSLKDDQIRHMTTAQLMSVTPEQLAEWRPAQAGLLSQRQRNAMTPEARGCIQQKNATPREEVNRRDAHRSARMERDMQQTSTLSKALQHFFALPSQVAVVNGKRLINYTEKQKSLMTFWEGFENPDIDTARASLSTSAEQADKAPPVPTMPEVVASSSTSAMVTDRPLSRDVQHALALADKLSKPSQSFFVDPGGIRGGYRESQQQQHGLRVLTTLLRRLPETADYKSAPEKAVRDVIAVLEQMQDDPVFFSLLTEQLAINGIDFLGMCPTALADGRRFISSLLNNYLDSKTDRPLSQRFDWRLESARSDIIEKFLSFKIESLADQRQTVHVREVIEVRIGRTFPMAHATQHNLHGGDVTNDDIVLLEKIISNLEIGNIDKEAVTQLMRPMIIQAEAQRKIRAARSLKTPEPAEEHWKFSAAAITSWQSESDALEKSWPLEFALKTAHPELNAKEALMALDKEQEALAERYPDSPPDAANSDADRVYQQQIESWNADATALQAKRRDIETRASNALCERIVDYRTAHDAIARLSTDEHARFRGIDLHRSHQWQPFQKGADYQYLGRSRQGLICLYLPEKTDNRENSAFTFTTLPTNRLPPGESSDWQTGQWVSFQID